MRRRQFYVYIMTNKSRMLYVGVTNDLQRRVYEHRQRDRAGFTARYNVNKLVYFEITESIRSAIAREKHLKGWTREKKIALVKRMNPGWRDLSRDWNVPAA